MEYSEIFGRPYPNILPRADLLREKGLGEERPNERYGLLTRRYKKYLEAFLKEKLPLELVDRRLTESELDFRPVPPAKQDDYQKSSGMGLRFFYLRNNLYIEKLSPEELRLLETKEQYDDEVRALLASTAERVVNPFDETHIVFYGPENGKFLCDSNAIVIGFRYDEFDTDLADDAFTENFLQKQRLVSQLETVFEVVGIDLGEGGVRLIQYNEFSVRLSGSEA